MHRGWRGQESRSRKESVASGAGNTKACRGSTIFVDGRLERQLRRLGPEDKRIGGSPAQHNPSRKAKRQRRRGEGRRRGGNSTIFVDRRLGRQLRRLGPEGRRVGGSPAQHNPSKNAKRPRKEPRGEEARGHGGGIIVQTERSRRWGCSEEDAASARLCASVTGWADRYYQMWLARRWRYSCDATWSDG
jgi:hypothetical protein